MSRNFKFTKIQRILVFLTYYLLLQYNSQVVFLMFVMDKIFYLCAVAKLKNVQTLPSLFPLV